MSKVSWLYRPGDKIQNYSILSRLGAGGMGQVYLCRDSGLSRNVAIKVLPKGVDEEDDIEIRRFIQEGRLLAQINHPNISSVYSIGEDESCAFLVMEYIKGELLHNLIREGRLNFQEKAKILQGVALGLAEAHKIGIVHRDVKPANIIVDEAGRGKLIDFGIAKAIYSKNEVTTETDAVIGTMNYIAPEIFGGSFPSVRSDIYALGLVLFEMVTGTIPFEAPSRLSVLENIRTRNLKFPLNAEPLLPRAFFHLIQEATDPSPEKRTATALEFYNRLQEINFSHIPAEYLLALRKVEVSNRAAVLQQLGKSDLPRALWPLAISKALHSTPHDQVNSPVEIVHLPTENLNKSVIAVDLMRRKSAESDAPEKTKENSARIAAQMSHDSGRSHTPASKPPAAIAKVSRFEMVLGGLLVVLGVVLTSIYSYSKLTKSDSQARSAASVQESAPKAAPAPNTVVPPPVEATVTAKTPPVELPQSEIAMMQKKYPSVGLYKEGETDDWPAVPMANLRIGTKAIYRDMRFYGYNKARIVRELWELVGFEGNTLKWKIQEIDKDGNLLFKPWHGWHRNNAQFTADTKSEASHFIPAFEATIVGNPDEIFPMRKGRVVVHEVFGESDMGRHAIRMRAISMVKDWETVSTAVGTEKAIRIDAFFDSASTPDVIYYSPNRQLILLWRGPRLDRRPYEIVKELEAVVQVGEGQDFASHLKALAN